MKRRAITAWSLALLSVCPLFAYRIIHDKNSKVVDVDLYVRPAKNAADALKKHMSLITKTGIPDTVVTVSQIIKKVSVPVAKVLNNPTSGMSVKVASGIGITADVLKKINDMFNPAIKDIIGRIDRGKDEAYHANVVRGNRGRGAEWAVNKDMYVIVTLPGSYAPISEPFLVPSRSSAGFTVNSVPDPEIPGNVILTAEFNPMIVGQGIAAEDDTRDKNRMKELAQENGEWAYRGEKPSVQELAAIDQKILEQKKAQVAQDDKEALKALGLPENATDYQVLGVSNNATLDQITKAYRALVTKWHPDRYPDKVLGAKVFRKVQAAYDALRNPPAKA